MIPLDIGYVFDLIITLFSDDEYVKIRIINQHTNIVLIEKNNDIIFKAEIEGSTLHPQVRIKDLLTMDGIWDFINSLDVSTKDT